SYTGVDLSEGMIEIARSKFPSGEFVVASVEDFLNQGEKYDLIFSTSFLHHVFDLTEVFDLIAACLNEGGVFVAVHEPLRKDLSSDRTPISEVFDQALGVALGWDTGPLPFRKKVMKSLGVLGKSAFGGAAKINSEFDLVDYQLNYEFNPSLVHNACTKSGLTGHVLIYSYLRFDMIRRFFGGARNYFAFVGVRN
ncbi:MAG: class I SAM-dependent methyltransferase, partial [Rhodospirillales bacterium]|nr:class I SAM-dependent methyltransferase [Rhodospirillales bacterium]